MIIKYHWTKDGMIPSENGIYVLITDMEHYATEVESSAYDEGDANGYADCEEFFKDKME